MVLKLYNTYAKREEEFVPIKKGKVRMYTCGPTVYGRPHIGNYSSFLMADLLRRWLQFGLGYDVTHVKNITDVGHLVADADEGEDKVEKEARRIAQEQRGKGAKITMKDVLAVAEMYTQQYLEDEKTLNLVEPEHRPKATETIPEMIATVEKLVKNGHAYETDDGVYFSVESFPDYGKLSGNTLENLESGSRVAVKEQKKHPADFALWKKCIGENANHVLRWDSPWGVGFPGWHIECSAMATKFLGECLDIHTGGEDNIFPHHESEIAQSECASGKHPYVRYWVHKRRINIASTSSAQGGVEKMSKSLGNVLTIPDITEMGYSPLDLRYYFLSVHYRTQLKFTKRGLEGARKARRKIVESFIAMQEIIAQGPDDMAGSMMAGQIQPMKGLFIDAMNDDLNTPGALAQVFNITNIFNVSKTQMAPGYSREDIEKMKLFMDLVRNTFGCFEPEESEPVPEAVEQLLDRRAKAREEKDFQTSDRLRDEIRALGYEVRDTDGGQSVKQSPKR